MLQDTEERRLIERLEKIEALFARPGSDGEKAAAGSARERILARLEQLERVEQPEEFRFSMPDSWSRRLFLALLRRYGIKPYRYRRQRRTTVMAKVAPSFCNEVLWPEYQEIVQTLRMHLDSVTDRIIGEAFNGGGEEAEERAGELGDG